MKVGVIISRVKNRLAALQAPPPELVTRQALRHYIQGRGIEIGALHRPLNIDGLPVTEIRYVDRRSTADLYQTYPELQAYPLTHVDVIDDGETLDKIANDSLDFIIANHFLEHTRDPIGTLENWLHKLTGGGVIFLALPDMRFTFDKERPLTPLSHLIADYQATSQVRQEWDRQHFVEWATFIDKLAPEQIEERVAFLIEVDYSIHFHTFTLPSFLDLVDHLTVAMKLPFQLIACADTLPQGQEFIVVLKRRSDR